MFLLYDTGEPILDPDDYEETFQAAVKPLLEMEQMDQRFGPCEDDCAVTAQYIDGSEGPFDPDFSAEMRAFEKFLRSGVYPDGLYPETFWDGAKPLPCGGILSNKV